MILSRDHAMDTSKLVKFAIGLALAMGLLASFANSSATKVDAEVEEVPTTVEEAIVPETVIDQEPVIRSTRREKKPTLSKATKEQQSRLDDERERIPQNWGERGMPDTDSVSTKIIRSTKT